ncbi:MAG: hypothetical protein U0136_06485 [Bdellovibrionota bacterium]
MTWSQLRKNAREFLCPVLAKRIDYHLTSYHRDQSESGEDRRYLGRGWITLDGEEIANFSGKAVHLQSEGHQAEEGDRQDLYEAIKIYPQLSIDEALSSASPVIQGMALFDRRVGKKRLAKYALEGRPPFVERCFQIRCEAEGLELRPESSSPRT